MGFAGDSVSARRGREREGVDGGHWVEQEDVGAGSGEFAAEGQDYWGFGGRGCVVAASEVMKRTNSIKMVKEFFIQCMLFRSKEKLHRFLGIFCWLNLLQAVLSICGLVSKYCH